MGLVQDATVLASSGYAKTSSALSLLSKMGNEKEYLGELSLQTCIDTPSLICSQIVQSGKRSLALSVV